MRSRICKMKNRFCETKVDSAKIGSPDEKQNLKKQILEQKACNKGKLER